MDGLLNSYSSFLTGERGVRSTASETEVARPLVVQKGTAKEALLVVAKHYNTFSLKGCGSCCSRDQAVCAAWATHPDQIGLAREPFCAWQLLGGISKIPQTTGLETHLEVAFPVWIQMEAENWKWTHDP